MPNEQMWTITEPCLNRVFQWEELKKKRHSLKIFVLLHGPTTWKVMPRNVGEVL